MINRKEVDRLLLDATTNGVLNITHPMIAELCRTWLAVQDAPRVGLFDSRHHGWSIDGDLPERFSGTDVRIVPDPVTAYGEVK